MQGYMMNAIPDQTRTKQRVQQWWYLVKSRNRLFFKLASASPQDIQRIRDLDGTLAHLQHEYTALESAYFPPGSENIRRAMLAGMINIIACLQHARLKTDNDRDVLLQIAAVDFDMLQTFLMEQGLQM